MVGEIAYKPSEDLYADVPQILSSTKKEYFPSFYEWLEWNGEEIHEAGGLITNGGAEDWMYEIPAGKTFFLTYASIENYNTVDILPAGITSGWLGTVWRSILSIMANGKEGAKYKIQKYFPIPMRFISGEKIKLNNCSVGVYTHARITGFLVDTKILKNF